MPLSKPATTSYVDRGEGRVAYDVQGNGPLVVLLHGMGVNRSVYRFTAPELAAAGFRVAAMDARGHGESDATFSSYDDEALATDALALVEHLGGGPALLVGNSMGSSAAVIAAAERPSAVAGLVLAAPFVRDPAVNFLGRPRPHDEASSGPRAAANPVTAMLLRVAMLRPWGPGAWRSYYRSLYPTRKPSDFDVNERQIGADLRRKWRAFVRTTRTSHEPARRRLPRVASPALVVMGTADRDWADPVAEARFVTEALNGELLLVEGAGHYPMTEFPELVNPAVVEFARRTLVRG